MTPSRWQQIEELYHAALECEPGERSALLARTDPELRREVESLLAQGSGATPLNHPAWEGAASLLGSTVAVLTPGTQLGPYKIEGPLGAGGMGEVFRATDTRLGRSVAIKTSREQFSLRFDREARAISSLNHPHVCTLFDVGPNYLVMELCEGETLAARLNRGKLSIQETLRYGAQIADALAAAHANGITHRDLKPDNIMLTKAGVKVLDFGLAKSPQDETLTGSRVVMGTPAYMAPEQKEGKVTDARTDIYALGLVLYGMAAGRRVVSGEIPSMEYLPPQLAHVIERCIAPDPDERWQAARDVRAELQWTTARYGLPASVPHPHRGPWWAWAIGGLVLILGVVSALTLSSLAKKPAPEHPYRFRIALPDGVRMVGRSTFSISPDGKTLAFMARSADGVDRVWVQRLGELEAKFLPETDSPPQSPSPFWSPDSKTIGFYSGGKLKTINPNGGAPQTICDIPVFPSGGSWNQNGVIIFGSLSRGMMRVPATGGTPALVTAVDSTRERIHAFPVFLPDGRHFLYLRGGDQPETTGIYIGSIDLEPSKQEQKPLLISPYAAQIVPLAGGKTKLVSLRAGTVMAQDFDTANLRLTGDPVAVAEHVGNSLVFGFFAASASTLAYRTTSDQFAQLHWFDREGKMGAAVGEPIPQDSGLALAADGNRAMVSRLLDKTSDIWLLDISRDVFLRLTTDPGFNSSPVWSPDGKRFAFSSTRRGYRDLYLGGVDGVEQEVSLMQSGIPSSWSSDGRFLMYATGPRAAKADLWILPFEKGKPGTPFPFAASSASTADGVFSPDGRWIAYTSDETGAVEIYVSSFTPPAAGQETSGIPRGGKVRVSKEGGTRPRWRADGKEFYYVAPNGSLMGVQIASGESFRAEAPHALFALPNRTLWDVAPDGKRFLIGVQQEQATQAPFTVVTNWLAGLNR